MNDMKVAKQEDVEGDDGDVRQITSSDTETTGAKMRTAGTSSRGTSRFSVDDKHIIFGRGKGVNAHPGNQRMRCIIKKHRAQYHSSKRGEKSLLVRKVYNELISGGTKFLKQIEGQEDGWEEVSVKDAVAKVGHSIRCAKYRPSPAIGADTSKAGNTKNETSVAKSSPAVSTALPSSRIGSLTVRQEHTFGPQHVAVTGGLMMPFPRERIGIPSLFPSSLSSLDAAYLAEVERNRLRSLLSLTPGSLFSPSSTLNGVLSSPSQLFAITDQQQQIRSSLLGGHYHSSQAVELLSRYLEPK